jgi:NADPH-dependent curcumin reductase CurA
MSEAKSYFPGWKLNEAADGGVVVEVISAGQNARFAKGDFLVGLLPWRIFQVVKKDDANKLNPIPEPLKDLASYFVGACGMPGLSALLPIEHIAQPKEGEVAFVSGAAGAVGSVAGQIFKIKGLKVIGSAGTDEKVKLLKDLGFDYAFNYNTTNLDKALSEAAPDGIDVYFDNVGGKTLEIALNHMRRFGRVVLCGAISNYNTAGWESHYGVRTLVNAVMKSLKLQGFIVSDWASEFPSGGKQLVTWVKEGKLKVTETVKEGFDQIPAAFVGLFSGDNQGKMVVKVL